MIYQNNFEAKPKLILPRKNLIIDKTENNKSPYEYDNLMFEKRVIRGNTHSLFRYQEEVVEVNKKKIIVNKKKKSIANINNKENDEETNNKNKKVYTEDHLRLQTNLPPKSEMSTQTNYIIKKKIPDLSLKKYFGIDKEIQIDIEEIFKFDEEVEPLIQVLMARTLEESQLEVMEEEELKTLKARQELLYWYKQKEKRNLDELIKKEKEQYKKNINTKNKYMDIKDKKINIHKKLLDRKVSNFYLKNITNNSINNISKYGYFLNEKDNYIDNIFLNNLVNDIKINIINENKNNNYLKEILNFSNYNLVENHFKNIENENNRILENKKLRDQEEEERQKRRELKLKNKILKITEEKIINAEKEIRTNVLGIDKDNFLSNNFLVSNIHCNYKYNKNYVGLFGSYFGLTLLYLNYVINNFENDENYKNEDINKLTNTFLEIVFEYIYNNNLIIDINFDDKINNEINEYEEDNKPSLEPNWLVENYENTEIYNKFLSNLKNNFILNFIEIERMPILKDKLFKKLIEEIMNNPNNYNFSTSNDEEKKEFISKIKIYSKFLFNEENLENSENSNKNENDNNDNENEEINEKLEKPYYPSKIILFSSINDIKVSNFINTENLNFFYENTLFRNNIISFLLNKLKSTYNEWNNYEDFLVYYNSLEDKYITELNSISDYPIPIIHKVFINSF